MREALAGPRQHAAVSMDRRAVLAWAVWLAPGLAAGQGLSTPQPDLAAVQGAWRGTLTYRDYSRPDRRVTLPTRLFVALSAPGELTFHFIYDDGPGKTVHAYERMAFDFAGDALTWTSGHPDRRVSLHRITSSVPQAGGGRLLTFEREERGVVGRHTLSLHPASLSLGKEEGSPNGEFQFRNLHEFTRAPN